MSNLIQTTGLEFAEIKANLKNFLSSQTELADYDFDGSVISTILDVLAYNTHYNALYTNMAINEMFIDSASKRDSIVSLAKALGYTPKSVTSARASVNLTVYPGDPTQTVMTLPIGMKFSADVNNNSYTFNVETEVTAKKGINDPTFVFDNVTLVEGFSNKITYTKDVNTRFVIPESTVDMSTLKVSVISALDASTTIYNNAVTMVGTNSFDNVYFVKCRENGLYEIFFGDGTFGTVVPNGSTVKLSYLISSADAPNGANLFSYSGGFSASNVYTIETINAASGGSVEEDKESIRHFAPLAHQAQGRAVTTNDYAALVAEIYTNVETVSVWGGQDNDPPQYGKVFISAKPYGRNVFSNLEKQQLENGIIAKRGVVTVRPVFVDPEYFDIELISNVYFNPGATTDSSGVIGSYVREAILNYAKDLSKFDKPFRHSVITSLIGQANNSIVSSINTIRVRRELDFIPSVSSNYSVNFKNPIVESNDSSFYSTRFFMSGFDDRGYLKNIGTNIFFYTEDFQGVPTQKMKVGTLDYSGKITLQNLTITGLYDDKFEFVFYPSSYDVIPPNGIIVRLLDKYINVNVLVDSLSQSKSTKQEYIFSASR